MKHLLITIICILTYISTSAHVEEINDIWDIKYNNRPMVVEAYASWCAPCKVYKPIFAKLAREYEGKVDFYKVNIENSDAEDFVVRYEINSVPTTVFLWDSKGDATVEHSVVKGLISYDELRDLIEEMLNKQYSFKSRQMSSLSWSDFSPYVT